MKGDFTRLTFRPQKHYTSVRMQQGRLQLDSDWNEQIDVQSHLLHAQSVDMIGFESGVPSATLESGKLNRDGFKISVTPTGEDLAIAPGHLYVNGTLCELESGTDLRITAPPENKVIEVDTLTLDERSLEQDQWLEVYADKDGNPLETTQKVRIKEIDQKQRKLTLNEAIKVPSGRIRRLVTYRRQPDFPNSDIRLSDGIYAVYLDVWERHITSVEDPKIREVALSIPDTTTRTQTVWQLKLKLFKDLLEITDKPPNELDNSDWIALIQERWFPSIQALRDRMTQAKMNACAKKCPAVGNTANTGSAAGQTGSDRRLDNQLYRVEIHTPGEVGVATFKWSRDNGSVVSPIDTQKGIQGGVIPIEKSGLEAWTSAKPGQWIEISSTAQELQGQPGVLAPFQQATDTRILFNDARIAGGLIPSDAATVRRWDHATQQPSIPTSTEWIPLENGIKVCFQPDSPDTRYETGDYWLIPARAIDNDIQWTDNGAKPDPQPLAQSPAGIRHEYCLLALVKVEGGKFVVPQSSSDQAKFLRDCRVVFPPLMRCVDKDQGLFTGTLEVQSDFFVTGKGRAGIGTQSPTARLQVQGTAATAGTGKISLDGATVTAIDPEIKKQLNLGDTLLLDDGRSVLVNSTEPLTITPPLGTVADRSFSYQPAIARFDDSDRNTQFAVTAKGNVGIGTLTPAQKLDVMGAVKAINFLGDGATLDGVVKTQGDSTITGSLTITQDLDVKRTLKLVDNSLSGNVLTDGTLAGAKLSDSTITEGKLSTNAVSTSILQDGSVKNAKLATDAVTRDKIKSGEVGTSELADKSVTLEKLALDVRPIENPWKTGNDKSLFYNAGNVGIGANKPKSQLSVLGSAAIGVNYANNLEAPTNGLFVEGHVGIGTFANKSDLTAKLEVQGENKSSNKATLNITDDSRQSLFFVRNDGNVGINTDNPKSTLHVAGTVAIGGKNPNIPDNVALFVDGNVSGKDFTQISSRTLKQNIAELSSQEVTGLLASLNPVKFNYTTDQPDVVHAGFIAEDVPDLVASPDRQAVRLGDVVAILTKAVKDQRQAIASLSRIAKDQQAAIATLTEQIQQLERDRPI
jgi:Family of unknown function (DUF6519)/Chaperone of endosialidase